MTDTARLRGCYTKEKLMRHLIIAAVAWGAASSPAPASPALAICHKRYALCASSPTVAIPGETVKVAS